nr:MAG TPA: hypothetical protein [Caudoviricetes sp.]
MEKYIYKSIKWRLFLLCFCLCTSDVKARKIAILSYL